MRRVVVGTAGHIDHGKTSLVEALTGIDCDRWAEEKARGITIDLGFAHLAEGDLQVGFVDVPGHERFLHNALAGLGGIRVMLLVVAADEGVKPQTREHLDICGLLGIPAGLVALTKTDLVDSELAELAALEIEELLAATPFAGAEVMPVSSVTGDGVQALRERLLDLAAEHVVEADLERPARLPIDRAFHLKGLGLVVTGTLVSGAIRPGDELDLLPAGARAPARVRVRDVQVHGEARERAMAGERTSLRLTGTDLSEIERGVQLVTPEAFGESRDLAVRFRLLPDAPAAIDGFVPVRLHLFSSEVTGKLRPLDVDVLEPGGEAVAELRLGQPVVAQRGDRFILRRPSPATTLGGGAVLDPAWCRQRGKRLAAALAGLAEEPAGSEAGGRAADRELERVLLHWVAEAGEGGVRADELARRLGERPERIGARLQALAREGRALPAAAGHGQPERWITPTAVERVSERAGRVVARFFERDRMASGMPKAEAIERILPGQPQGLAETYLGWLGAAGTLVVEGGKLDLPGRGSRLTNEESGLAERIERAFESAGLTPPSPAEVARSLGAKPQIVDGIIRYLGERGRLVRLPGGLILAQAAVERLRRDLLATGWERFGVPQFKDRFGLSRKWAIPILEHLDSAGATRRLGDERMVVR